MIRLKCFKGFIPSSYQSSINSFTVTGGFKESYISKEGSTKVNGLSSVFFLVFFYLSFLSYNILKSFYFYLTFFNNNFLGTPSLINLSLISLM